MKYGENKSTTRGTRIFSGEVTSRYKKNYPAIPERFSGFSDELVKSF